MSNTINATSQPIIETALKKPRSKRGKAIFHITLNGLDYQEMEKNDDGNYDCEMTKDDNNSSDNNNHNINSKDFVWYKFAKCIKGLKNPPVERKKQKKRKLFKNTEEKLRKTSKRRNRKTPKKGKTKKSVKLASQ